LPTPANATNHKWLGLPLTLLDQEIPQGAQDFFTPYIMSKDSSCWQWRNDNYALLAGQGTWKPSQGLNGPRRLTSSAELPREKPFTSRMAIYEPWNFSKRHVSERSTRNWGS
jgi:hypothetical protein